MAFSAEDLIIYDLDNTVWNTQVLGDREYEAVSERFLGRSFSLRTHPVTGEPDSDYAKHSNGTVMRYKIKQILEAGGELVLQSNRNRITDASMAPIGSMVEALSDAGIAMMESEGVDGLVTQYITPGRLGELHGIFGAASFSPRKLQEYLLRTLGYLDAEHPIDKDLCSFNGLGVDKEDLLMRCCQQYMNKFGHFPLRVAYIGDAVHDMQAAASLRNEDFIKPVFDAIGVTTGLASAEELYAAGADLVVDTLASKQDVAAIAEYLGQAP